jgi:hypothetical protein
VRARATCSGEKNRSGSTFDWARERLHTVTIATVTAAVTLVDDTEEVVEGLLWKKLVARADA